MQLWNPVKSWQGSDLEFSVHEFLSFSLYSLHVPMYTQACTQNPCSFLQSGDLIYVSAAPPLNPLPENPNNKEQQPGRGSLANPKLSEELLPKRGIKGEAPRYPTKVSYDFHLFPNYWVKSWGISERAGLLFWKGKGSWLWQFVARKQTKGLVFFMAFTQTKWETVKGKQK